MAGQQTNIRMDAEIKAAAIAAAAAKGITLGALIEQALGQYLGRDIAAPSSDIAPEGTGHSSDIAVQLAEHSSNIAALGEKVEDAIAAVERRLNRLESQPTKPATPTSTPSQTPAAADSPQAAAPAPASETPPSAQPQTPTSNPNPTQSAASDATLRRWWIKAGRPGAGFLQWAEAEGWRSEGTGNQRKWRRG